MRGGGPARGVARGDYSDVAVLIPCYNEGTTVGKVVSDFRAALPGATVYVYDNNSTDGTAEAARGAGAVVRREPRQGKGRVVRQMHRDVDASFYVMVDGDDTYPAEAAPELLEPLMAGEADHAVGDRLSSGAYGEQNGRAFHAFGNDLVRWLIRLLYGFDFADVMTGYRAYTRPFAKTFPCLSRGFQVETELSIFAVDRAWRTVQVPVAYRDRPEGSQSKLATIPDGVRVLAAIAGLAKDWRPLPFFVLLALACLALCLATGLPVVYEFGRTGLVERFPTAFLAMGLGILSALLFSVGLVLDTEVRSSRRAWELEATRAFGEWRLRWASEGEAPVATDAELLDGGFATCES